jgi:cell division control protein 6
MSLNVDIGHKARRHGSTSHMVSIPPGTPSSALSFLAIQTPPTTPTTNLPLYARTRALLRTTCNNAGDIAGRTAEANSLRSFITAFIRANGKAGTAEPFLYISGSPGCGKTALVNSMLASLEGELQGGKVQLVVVNCMALNGLDAVWDRLLSELGGSKKRAKKVVNSELVEELLTSNNSKWYVASVMGRTWPHHSTLSLLVLDEVDHIASSSQSLSKLFNLSQHCACNLRVIGIANTHTLSSATSTASIAGIAGVKTLHFAPYEPVQLVKILQSRLGSLAESVPDQEALKKFLPPATLKLLSMKIASQTGDVRAVFEVLRNAIDISIAQASSPKDDRSPVTPAHIQAALKAYAPASRVGPVAMNPGSTSPQCNSELVTKIRNLGLHSRLALLALLIACRRAEAGLPTASSIPAGRTMKRAASQTSAAPPANTSIDTSQLHALYIAMLTRDNSGIFAPVSRSEFTDLVNVLETVGLLERPSGALATPTKTPTKRKFARTGSFGNAASQNQEVVFTEGVRAAEVLRGLGIEADAAPADKNSRVEEEAAAIWNRELARIRKEAKLAAPKKKNSAPGFAEAEED